jgi:hypothetical protein
VAAFLQLLRRSREEDERAKKDMLLMLLYIESREVSIDTVSTWLILCVLPING